MTIDRETVIRFAEKAWLPIAWISETGVITWAQLERFATLVLGHERKPLTYEQRRKVLEPFQGIAEDDLDWDEVIQAVEAAHGITNKESSDA